MARTVIPLPPPRLKHGGHGVVNTEGTEWLTRRARKARQAGHTEGTEVWSMLRMAQTGLFLRESFPRAEHAQQALPPLWSPCRPQGGFRALRV